MQTSTYFFLHAMMLNNSIFNYVNCFQLFEIPISEIPRINRQFVVNHIGIFIVNIFFFISKKKKFPHR